MKIAFISDIHVGPSGYYNGIRRKLTEYSEQYISDFVQYVSQSTDYAFAIQLGDLIQDADRETDLQNWQKGLELFRSCSVPIYHLVGNHDTVNIAVDEIREMLGYRSLYYSFDEGGYHFVVLHSYVPVPKQPRIIVPDEQLAWLKNDLAGTALPTCVFAHHSFADQDLQGNPWFEGRPEDCLVENRAEVRQVFEQSEKVIAVINGHLHWNRMDYHDQIPYITVQSATENFNDDGIPANSWGVIELAEQKITLEVIGNDYAKYESEIGVMAV